MIKQKLKRWEVLIIRTLNLSPWPQVPPPRKAIHLIFRPPDKGLLFIFCLRPTNNALAFNGSGTFLSFVKGSSQINSNTKCIVKALTGQVLKKRQTKPQRILVCADSNPPVGWHLHAPYYKQHMFKRKKHDKTPWSGDPDWPLPFLPPRSVPAQENFAQAPSSKAG